MVLVILENSIPRSDLKLRKASQIRRQQQSEALADNGRKFILPMAAYMANLMLNK